MTHHRLLILTACMALSFSGAVSAQEDGMMADEGMDVGMDSMMESMGGDIELFTAPSHEEIEFFEKHIRPVLVDHCYGCHSEEADRIRGGLTLDTRAGIHSVLTPGDADGSLLIESLRYDDEFLQMPPRGKLPADVIRAFEQWVEMGAPDPRSGEAPVAMPEPWEMDLDTARDFWSLKPPVDHGPPDVENAKWPRSDVDRYILAGLEEEGLRPVADAEKAALLRRVTFDLTGLPPTPAEVDAFVSDRSANAYEKVVDRLLASSHFGERWGRHWLDVARYAESSGKEVNIAYPHAWRYRDYVIDAFNADKAFDDFVREQLAGDLLPAEDEAERAEHQVATGFLAIGSKSHATRGTAQFLLDVADEQIDTMSQGMLGMTLSCARCHDHKFDPISQVDYYAMAGVFASTETCYGTTRAAQNRHAADLLTLSGKSGAPAGRSMTQVQRRAVENRLAQSQASIDRILEQYDGGRPSRDDENAARLRRLRSRQTTIEAILDRYDESGRPNELLAMGVREGEQVRDVPLLLRGELEQAADPVPRGLPEVLNDGSWSIGRQDSGRLVVADWIASDRNPLTARVWVNRVWLHLFGKPIVPTPDNFGRSGLPPSHPELLDHLAVRFMEDDWSTKTLIRYLVTSRTYRMSSRHNNSNHEVDPDNELYWRMDRKRLEAEAIRDAMLFASGNLEVERPMGSPVSLVEGNAGVLAAGSQVNAIMDQPIRSVYLPVIREMVPESLDVFDFAEPSFVTGDRDETTVPSQALFLLNSPFVMAQADAMAQQLLAMNVDDGDRVRHAFQIAFGRQPHSNELRAARKFFQQFPAAQGTALTEDNSRQARRRRGRNRRAQNDATSEMEAMRRMAWGVFCQSLFASAEFRYVN